MKTKMVLTLIAVMVSTILLGNYDAISQIPDEKTVNIDTTVFKRFVVKRIGDVSCTFTVEIDPARVDAPLVKQETSCNNLLQFQSNASLEVTIGKVDASPSETTPGELAILDALGVKIDTVTVGTAGNGFFATGCTFFDAQGVETTAASLADVLGTQSDIWYDPQVDGATTEGSFFNTQTIRLNHPVAVGGTYDCRFKLEFFLSTDDFQLLPAGLFSYVMTFTSSAAS